MDLSHNPVLTYLDCSSCNLTSLDCQNTSISFCGGEPIWSDGNRKRSILNAKSNLFDLNNLPDFEVGRTSNWKGGRVVNGHYLEYDSKVVRYRYEYKSGFDSCMLINGEPVHTSGYMYVALWVKNLIDLTVEGTQCLYYKETEVSSDIYLSVPYVCEKVTVGASATRGYAQILSGFGEHHLEVGENNIEIAVTEEGTQQTHTLTIRRISEDAAWLQSLSVSAGTLEPAFSPEVYDYQIEVPYEADSIEVFAEARYDSAMVSGIGKYRLKVGENVMYVGVRAEDDLARQTYKLTVVRHKADLALQSLTVSDGTLMPAFDPEVYEYDLAWVLCEPEILEVCDEPHHERATVSGTGKYYFGVGRSWIIIVYVKAMDGKYQAYRIRVRTKADAALRSLSVSAGALDPTFSSEVHAYRLEVPYETDSLEVFAETKYNRAELSGIGRYGLAVGDNEIKVETMAIGGWYPFQQP
ncbi:MAG: cadherin-like beta sandwich domain-containing protein, partial [Bacteroidales bacterium]|nr:cadherin-like beta sandwich domain-containing protein [Bacteroidales bacterium]